MPLAVYRILVKDAFDEKPIYRATVYTSNSNAQELPNGAIGETNAKGAFNFLADTPQYITVKRSGYRSITVPVKAPRILVYLQFRTGRATQAKPLSAARAPKKTSNWLPWLLGGCLGAAVGATIISNAAPKETTQEE